MIKALNTLPLLPLLALGVLGGAGSAQAGFISPPPPEGNVAFSPVVLNGSDAGVDFYLRDVGEAPPGGFANYAGSCVASPTGECTYFDWLPPQFGGVGNFEVDNTSPAGGPFSALVPGSIGQLKDFVFPFLGAPIDQPNLNAPFNITALVDLDPTGGDAVIDTFDATLFQGLIFQNVGTGSVVNFNFAGFWNVETSPGVVEQFEGTVTLSQALVDSVDEVLAQGRTAAGFRTSYSGQGNIFPPEVNVPEPSSLAGLAALVGTVAMMRKRRTNQ